MIKDITPSITVDPEMVSRELPLLPLKNMVILPKTIIPILVGRASSVKAVEAALGDDKEIFITAQKNIDTEQPTAEDVFTWGTRATILQVTRMPKNSLKILVEGISRAQASGIEAADQYLVAQITDQPTRCNESQEAIALWHYVVSLFADLTKLNSKLPQDLITDSSSVEDMDWISDTLPLHLNATLQERQALLETPQLEDRLLALIRLLKKDLEIAQTQEKIRGRVQDQVEKHQREYYLSEQLKAIQKELGRDEQAIELAQIRSKIQQLTLPEEVAERAEKEIRRLEMMPPMSAEASISRHYLDWITALPWHLQSKDTLSLDEAQKVLDAHHAGLSKVKERVMEYLAAHKFAGNNATQRTPVLCLVGAPGVGKTSLARSIAASLGRDFVRISLGGVRDEAEIRGHRRTYVGALPGKIVQAMRKAKTVNPVILLDEIDKMSQDIHGDPGAALLEVLDPEQNKNFTDHFLEIGYDLSQVLFIATANHLDGIPYPLFDRMELITIAGYTDAEKMAIASSFLLPKNRKELGLKSTQVRLSQDVLHFIMHHYTKEAGVRQLDRVIARILRKSIQQLLLGKKQITISKETVINWLGQPKYNKPIEEEAVDPIGLATGLAWTELGGDLLDIEVAVTPGKGNMTLTGQLGEVMQESAHAALSYIRMKASTLGLKPSFNASKDIHIHVPEGATPKDGPSAGITMCTALVSALTKVPVLKHVAMTGEITLRGRVLAVGGLKEKILAAVQHKKSLVIVPFENKDEIEEFLSDIPSDLTLIYAKDMDDVLKVALQKSPFNRRMKKTKISKTVTKST